jgi:hypothetical protein
MTSHWLHGNSTPKFGSHFLGPGPIALPKNTLPTVQCTSGVCSFSLALQSCKRPSGWGIPKWTGPPHPPRLLPCTKPILEKELLPFLSGEMWGESTKHWYSWFLLHKREFIAMIRRSMWLTFLLSEGFVVLHKGSHFLKCPWCFYANTQTRTGPFDKQRQLFEQEKLTVGNSCEEENHGPDTFFLVEIRVVVRWRSMWNNRTGCPNKFVIKP